VYVHTDVERKVECEKGRKKFIDKGRGGGREKENKRGKGREKGRESVNGFFSSDATDTAFTTKHN
jgi:hypothetical protein